MSYRALITLTAAGAAPAADYCVALGEDWNEGEVFAHNVAASTLEIGLRNAQVIAQSGGASPRGPFRDGDQRARWIESWADQAWEVAFERDGPDGEFARVTITGRDASGEVFFLRRTSYSLAR